MSNQQLEATAHHEAGHVVITRLLGYPVHSATIKPGDGYQGAALSDNPLYDRDPSIDGAESGTDEKMRHRAIAALAGSVAERRFNLEIFDIENSSEDYEVVFDICLRLGGDVDGASKVGDELLQQTEALVLEHWLEIDRVARVLLDRTELSVDDIKRINE